MNPVPSERQPGRGESHGIKEAVMKTSIHSPSVKIKPRGNPKINLTRIIPAASRGDSSHSAPQGVGGEEIYPLIHHPATTTTTAGAAAATAAAEAKAPSPLTPHPPLNMKQPTSQTGPVTWGRRVSPAEEKPVSERSGC